MQFGSGVKLSNLSDIIVKTNVVLVELIYSNKFQHPENSRQLRQLKTLGTACLTTEKQLVEIAANASRLQLVELLAVKDIYMQLVEMVIKTARMQLVELLAVKNI